MESWHLSSFTIIRFWNLNISRSNAYDSPVISIISLAYSYNQFESTLDIQNGVQHLKLIILNLLTLISIRLMTSSSDYYPELKAQHKIHILVKCFHFCTIRKTQLHLSEVQQRRRKLRATPTLGSQCHIENLSS